MSYGARTKKTSVSSPKKKSTRIPKNIRKKSSQILEQTFSSTRQKRLSSLTARTLLHYCTSILSPSRKFKSNPKKTRKRQISENNEPELHIPIRIRREASSRASAMIMQQNEIERSRYTYSEGIQRHRSKNTITNKDDIPNIPAPSIADISNQTEYIQPSNIIPIKSTHSSSSSSSNNSKYPILTEALLAEHNRLHETITNKHDNLVKWTEEIALCGRLSPPYSADEIPPESNTKQITSLSKPLDSLPTFLFPSSTYSLDYRPFYPLLPYWQYPNWPFQPSTLVSIPKQKRQASTFHLHTHHHHIHNSNLLTLNVNKTDEELLNLSINSKKTTRRKSSRINSGIPSIDEKIPQRINTNENEKPIRRILKRRSVSATAATNTSTIISITGRNSRQKRANSATNSKQLYSPVLKKKSKVLHYWILFGKSEQKLVSIHADKPPVLRECYSSIRHITEKDVIKSNDCVILRSDTGIRSTYLAKVKCFWKESTTDEIQMSLIWYYHPEHTELPLHIKNQFLSNELLASKHWDCVSVECIEDKCYVLNLNEYNRYYFREKSVNLFENSESINQLKFLLNKNTSTIHHRLLPAKTVGNQSIFFCRYIYDYRVKRILKNPTCVTTA